MSSPFPPTATTDEKIDQTYARYVVTAKELNALRYEFYVELATIKHIIEQLGVSDEDYESVRALVVANADQQIAARRDELEAQMEGMTDEEKLQFLDDDFFRDSDDR